MGALPIDPANLPFWHDLEANDLAVILASERPTVIAVVLNQIPVELATGLLQQLPKAIALESLAKLPQLQSTPPDLLNEINQHLQERISNFQIPKKLAMQNMEKLQAILGASNPSFRTECLDRIQSQFPTLAQKLGWPPSANAVDDSIAQASIPNGSNRASRAAYSDENILEPSTVTIAPRITTVHRFENDSTSRAEHPQVSNIDRSTIDSRRTCHGGASIATIGNRPANVFLGT